MYTALKSQGLSDTWRDLKWVLSWNVLKSHFCLVRCDLNDEKSLKFRQKRIVTFLKIVFWNFVKMKTDEGINWKDFVLHHSPSSLCVLFSHCYLVCHRTVFWFLVGIRQTNVYIFPFCTHPFITLRRLFYLCMHILFDFLIWDAFG